MSVSTAIFYDYCIYIYFSVTCPYLPRINLGYVYTSGNTPGSTARYSCYYPYKLVGNMTRVCQDDGQWSGEEPFCDCDFGESLDDGNCRCVQFVMMSW